MANWTNIFLMQQRGLELVARLNKANRKADFRRGKRLGKYDHIVSWRKPSVLGGLVTSTFCEFLIYPGLFWQFSGKDAERLAHEVHSEDEIPVDHPAPVRPLPVVPEPDASAT